MIHVYYSSVGAESAKLLVKSIEELGAPVTIHRQKNGAFMHAAKDLCVNWGARCPESYAPHWLNKRVFHNKFTQLRVMAENKVPVPEVKESRPSTGTWYARLVEHRDGSDLSLNLRQGDYYVKHVEAEREYRVHVFAGEIIRASLKVPLNNKATLPFRVGDHWGFSNRDHGSLLGPAKDAALRAVAALGYDFGGVDVAITSRGEACVFEVNSAPWLGGDAARKYAQRIVKLA